MTPTPNPATLLINSYKAGAAPCPDCNADAELIRDPASNRVTLLRIHHDPDCPVLARHGTRPNRAQRRAARRTRSHR